MQNKYGITLSNGTQEVRVFTHAFIWNDAYDNFVEGCLPGWFPVEDSMKALEFLENDGRLRTRDKARIYNLTLEAYQQKYA